MTRAARGVRWVTAAALSALVLITAGCMAERERPERAGHVSAAPAQSQPSAGEPAGNGTQYRAISFKRGERKLDTTVIWPSTGEGRLPLILFGHGLGGLPPFYGELLKRWAAAGFVVAAPAFPGTSYGVDRVEIRDVPNQPADVGAVLDGLLALDASDPIRQRIDPDRVAAAGHSAGAITTLGVFTASGPEGRDERFDAGIILAGNSLGVGERFTGDPVPLLFVHATGDQVVPASTGRSAYRAVPWPKAFLTLPGKEHITPYLAPGDPAFPVVVGATTDFLRWALLDDAEAVARLRKTPDLENKL